MSGRLHTPIAATVIRKRERLLRTCLPPRNGVRAPLLQRHGCLLTNHAAKLDRQRNLVARGHARRHSEHLSPGGAGPMNETTRFPTGIGEQIQIERTRLTASSPCQKSRGRRHAPLDRLRTAQPLQEGGASLCAQPSGRARNPLGDGHLRPSALSFVGGDHPDRHPPHFAPSDRRSPPRLPRDF